MRAAAVRGSREHRLGLRVHRGGAVEGGEAGGRDGDLVGWGGGVRVEEDGVVGVVGLGVLAGGGREGPGQGGDGPGGDGGGRH